MNILFVEDDPSVLSNSVSILKKKFPKFTFLDAKNIDDALGIINSDLEIELAVLDIHLGPLAPKGGLIIYKHFFKKNNLSDVVFITAMSTREILLDISQLTQVTFLMKPWHSIQLESIIKIINLKQVGLKEVKERIKSLSKREKEVAILLRNGNTNIQIAKALKIGSKSVHTYKTRIFNKLTIETLSELSFFFPHDFKQL